MAGMIDILLFLALGLWVLKQVGIDMSNPKTRAALAEALAKEDKE